MPYFSCPSCDLSLYGAAAPKSSEPCPRCGSNTVVVARPDPPPSIFRDHRVRHGAAPVVDLLELEERIAERIGHGGSLADVEREIIVSSTTADEDQKAALRLYARTLAHTRGTQGTLPLPTQATT